MLKLPLKEKKHHFELGYGDYYIYFVGGFSICNLEELKMELVDEKTNKIIPLKEKFFKIRDYINGEKAMVCYKFHLNSYYNLKLKIENPEVISMKQDYNIHHTIIHLFFKNRVVDYENIYLVIK